MLTKEKIKEMVQDISERMVRHIMSTESLTYTYIGEIPDEVRKELENMNLTVTSSYVEYNAVSVFGYSEWRWENVIDASENVICKSCLKSAVLENKKTVVEIITRIDILKKVTNATAFYVDDETVNNSVWRQLEEKGYEVRSHYNENGQCKKISWEALQ